MTRSPRHPARRRRRGFTLVELLVAVGIMVIMLLAFGQIVAQSQVLVESCQQIMRMNTTASVVAQLLERDLLSVSKEGYLQLGTNSLTFVRVASHTSVLNPAFSANAAVVKYNAQPTTDGGPLGRQAILLLGDSAGGGPADTNTLSLGAIVSDAGAIGFIPPDATLPPAGQAIGANAQTYWAYLAGGCTRFDVSCWPPKATAWLSTGSYTRLNATTWPLAVRVQFSLKDGGSKQDYEFITDLP